MLLRANVLTMVGCHMQPFKSGSFHCEQRMADLQGFAVPLMLKVAVSAAMHCHIGQLWRKHAVQQQPVTHVVILPPPPPEVGAKPIHPPDLLSGEDCDPSKEVLHRLQMSMCVSNREAQYNLELLPLLPILLNMPCPLDLLYCFVMKLAIHCSTVHADYTVQCFAAPYKHLQSVLNGGY